jgi:hypothetical protein
VRRGRVVARADPRERVEQAAPQRVGPDRHADVADEQRAEVRGRQPGRGERRAIERAFALAFGDARDPAIDPRGGPA